MVHEDSTYEVKSDEKVKVEQKKKKTFIPSKRTEKHAPKSNHIPRRNFPQRKKIFSCLTKFPLTKRKESSNDLPVLHLTLPRQFLEERLDRQSGLVSGDLEVGCGYSALRGHSLEHSRLVVKGGSGTGQIRDALRRFRE